MKRLILTSLCVLFFASTALAVPTPMAHVDGPQDLLFIPDEVDELGMGFPLDEWIDAMDVITDITVCFDPDTPDDPIMPNVEVVMTNMTLTTWTEVWYVADPEETTHSNFDGFAGMPGALMGTAFRIDNPISDPFGIHHPLIFEVGGAIPGAFEPFETWHFVIQDYSNVFGKPASLLGSFGVPSTEGAIGLSSGSIIAIPEPATIALFGLGSLSLIRRKRRA